MSSRKQRPESTDESAFVERAGALFRASVEELDASTASRLNRGRQAALSAAADDANGGRRWTSWAPATGIAAAAAVAVVVWNIGPGTGPEVGSPAAPFADISDIEILLDQDELEMLEDLDFYVWLGTEAGNGDVG